MAHLAGLASYFDLLKKQEESLKKQQDQEDKKRKLEAMNADIKECDNEPRSTRQTTERRRVEA